MLGKALQDGIQNVIDSILHHGLHPDKEHPLPQDLLEIPSLLASSIGPREQAGTEKVCQNISAYLICLDPGFGN